MFRPCVNYKIKKRKEKDNGYIFVCLEWLQITGASIIDMVLFMQRHACATVCMLWFLRDSDNIFNVILCDIYVTWNECTFMKQLVHILI